MDNTQLLVKQSLYERISRISKLSVNNLTTAIYYVRENWKSGMAQALMNIPFYLNAANNSGVDPAKGLWSAFVGAMVNGFLSGSNHSIYAPTWVTASYNYYLIQMYGFEVIPWVTVIIGVQIFIMSEFNWHHLLNFMPNYVIEGYYLGLGFIIMNGYIDYGFGLTDMHANRGTTVYADRFEMYQEYFKRGDLQHLLLSIGVFFLLYLGNKLDNTKPWIILTSFFGLMMGQLFPTERCLKSVYGNVKFQISHIQQGGPYFQPDIQLLGHLFTYSIPMTFYITLQNIICAKGADFQTGVKCDSDQEMLCVSISNILSGIFGGLPVCASIRMYFLNIKLKTNNKWSSIINAVSIFLIYGILGELFLEIPLYVISGHLLYCSYLCPTWSYLEMLVRTRRRAILIKQFVISLLCVYYGPLQSTIIGSLYAMLQFAETTSIASSEVIIDSEEINQQRLSIITQNKQNSEKKITLHTYDDRLSITASRALYRFNGSINYINIKNHIKQIKQLPGVENIILSFRYVSTFDDESIDKLATLTSNMISKKFRQTNKLESDRMVFITGLQTGMIEQLLYNEFFKSYMKDYPHRFKVLEKL